MASLVCTPPKITQAILDFCRQDLGCGGAPFFISIRPDPKAKAGKCHYNVEHAVKEQGGRQVYGWAIWQGHGWIEAEFHGVHETADGKLVDLTPDADGEDRRLFVVDTKHVFQDRAIPKHYKVLTSSAVVRFAIQKFASANKLRSQYVAGQPIPPADAAKILMLEAMGGLELQLLEVSGELQPNDNPANSSARERRIAKQQKRRAKKDRKAEGGAL